DVLVGDRAERFVLGPDLQPHHHRLVVNLIRDRLRLVALLRLALGRRVTQALRLGFGPLSGCDRTLAADQAVAVVTVRDLLHVAGAADVVDVLCQQDPQFTRPPTWIDIRRGGGLANGFDRPDASPHDARWKQYRGHPDPRRSASL